MKGVEYLLYTRRFNPSQVGYKRAKGWARGKGKSRFNPSQVGYKHFCSFSSECR